MITLTEHYPVFALFFFLGGFLSEFDRWIFNYLRCTSPEQVSQSGTIQA